MRALNKVKVGRVKLQGGTYRKHKVSQHEMPNSSRTK